jgi:cyanophycinase-like exopeptidase
MTSTLFHQGSRWAALLLAAALPLASGASALPRELILAGGALALCSDLGARGCTEAPAGAERQSARYRFDEAGLARALQPALWPQAGAPDSEVRRAWLTQAGAKAGDEAVDAAGAEAALGGVCLAARCSEADAKRPWSILLDSERGAVLAALEVPQQNAQGKRPTERAFPLQSRVEGGLAVMQAFVDAAKTRSPGKPRIAVVTASGFDPMEPVDFYLSMFEALGAEAVWWPVDAAVAAAKFEKSDCTALPALRAERLGLTQSERVYPDLAAYQRAYCDSQPALMLQVQGVFFAGGDQWRMRRAFVRDDDRPNDWLLELQQAYADGRVVVGGTSAGSAIQSGAWMLSNGDVEAAVARAARIAPPPEPGCSAGARCAAGVSEDSLTLWPAGGLRLADGAIVDTHFSERARELRLLMAMQAADARWGYGADETSALRVRTFADRREIDALGESGGWVMQRVDGDPPNTVRAWYLSPGATLVIRGDEATLQLPETLGAARRPRGARPSSAFESGALRAAAQRLAWRCKYLQRLSATPGVAELTCDKGAQAWRGNNGVNGVGPLALRFVSPASE